MGNLDCTEEKNEDNINELNDKNFFINNNNKNQIINNNNDVFINKDNNIFNKKFNSKFNKKVKILEKIDEEDYPMDNNYMNYKTENNFKKKNLNHQTFTNEELGLIDDENIIKNKKIIYLYFNLKNKKSKDELISNKEKNINENINDNINNNINNNININKNKKIIENINNNKKNNDNKEQKINNKNNINNNINNNNFIKLKNSKKNYNKNIDINNNEFNNNFSNNFNNNLHKSYDSESINLDLDGITKSNFIKLDEDYINNNSNNSKGRIYKLPIKRRIKNIEEIKKNFKNLNIENNNFEKINNLNNKKKIQTTSNLKSVGHLEMPIQRYKFEETEQALENKNKKKLKSLHNNLEISNNNLNLKYFKNNKLKNNYKKNNNNNKNLIIEIQLQNETNIFKNLIQFDEETNKKIIKLSINKLLSLDNNDIIYDGYLYKIQKNKDNEYKLYSRYFQITKNCFRYFNNINSLKNILVQFDIRHIVTIQIKDKNFLKNLNLKNIEFVFTIYIDINNDFFVFATEKEKYGKNFIEIIMLIKKYYEDFSGKNNFTYELEEND